MTRCVGAAEALSIARRGRGLISARVVRVRLLGGKTVWVSVVSLRVRMGSSRGEDRVVGTQYVTVGGGGKGRDGRRTSMREERAIDIDSLSPSIVAC